MGSDPAVGTDRRPLHAATPDPSRADAPHPLTRPLTRRRAFALLARLGAGATVASVTGLIPGVSGQTLAYAAEAASSPAGAPPPLRDVSPVALAAASEPSTSTPADARAAATASAAAPLAVPLAERITVEQHAQFSDVIGEALDEIAGLSDPRWADLVAQNLRVIRPARPGELPQGAFAGMFVSGGAGAGGDPGGQLAGGVAVFASTKADVDYLASVIVHEAWHYHQYLGGGAYYGRGAEQEAIQTQVDVLRALAPSHYALSYLEDSIAKVGDAGPLAGNPPR